MPVNAQSLLAEPERARQPKVAAADAGVETHGGSDMSATGQIAG
jgi:hypothetical protein